MTVDMGRVHDLQRESAATRAAILKAMERAGNEEEPNHETVAPPTKPMVAMVVGFDATQVEALRALLDEADPDAALRRIAAAAELFPEVLLDSINEVGSEVFGDAVIDLSGPTPQVHDEYAHQVRAIVAG